MRATTCIITAQALAIWALAVALFLQPRSQRLSIERAPAAVRACESGDGRAAVHYADSVVLEHGVASALLHVAPNGTLARVQPSARDAARAYAAAHALPFVDHAHLFISPGLIDVHVHVSGVGRAWEGYESATRAAAAGGLTAIVCMPLNSLPPTTSAAALCAEAEALRSAGAWVDVGFWAGAVPASVRDGTLRELLRDERVLGVKAFLSPLPPAAGFEALSPTELRAAAAEAAAASLPLLVHCELMTAAELDALVAEAAARGTPRDFGSFVRTRPPAFETRAIDALVDTARQLPALRAHVVHLSAAAAAAGRLRAARAELGPPPDAALAAGALAHRLTVETCPHYLAFDDASVPDGDTRFKCFPPLRDPENRQSLWRALRERTIDLLASDHSPTAAELRLGGEGDFLRAWAGISGLQFSLAATFTELVRRAGAHDLAQLRRSAADLALWWSENPARLAGMWARKGSLAEGKDADFVAWDPWAVGAMDHIFHRHAGTPYAGMRLRGHVRRTYVRGREAFRHEPDAARGEDAAPSHGEACGRVLVRS